MISNSCDICVRRRGNDFTTVSDEELEAWWLRDVDGGFVCSSCFGVLQFGKPIISAIRSKFEELNYTEIFSCPLSIQLPALMVFRNYIEKVVCTATDPDSRYVDVRDVLRNLISRSVISENPNELMPKLFLEVKFEPSPEWVLPDQVVKAINARAGTTKNGFKKTKTKSTANIADVQQYVEFTKGDLVHVFESLLSGESISDSEKSERLVRTFITPNPPIPTINVCMKRETLYLVGKYVKDTREFGQSAWDSNATSVAETICPIVCELFKSPIDKCLFSASGREDMDVRMLGSGRTFVLQVGDARTLQPLLERSILSGFKVETGDVRVDSGVRFVDKGVMDWLHWSTEQHLKIYRCVVWAQQIFPCQEELNKVTETRKDVKIFQKTPLRVLHRRTEHTREKYMHSLQFERLNDHFALVTLKASAGAYIKEFVHGDFGRTIPSFSDLVFGKPVRCDILQLDVLEVQQDEDEEYVPLCERQ